MNRVAAVTIGIALACAAFANTHGKSNHRDPGPGDVQVNQSDAVQTLTFHTGHGQVVVHAPLAQDSFSGRVVAYPAGDTEKEQAAHRDALEGMVVDIGGQKSPVKSGIVRYAVPIAAAGVPSAILLRSSSGKPVVQAAQPLWQTPRSPVLSDVVSQAQPVAIPGAFDGDVSTTAASMSGRPAQMLLETKDLAVAEAPRDTLGPGRLEVKEGDRVFGRSLNVASISLAASKHTLFKGEQATLQLRARGLQGARPGHFLKLTNATPGIVTLSGGDTQMIRLEESMLDNSGGLELTRTLTGVTPGRMLIVASMAGPGQTGTSQDGGQEQPVDPKSCECQTVEVKPLLDEFKGEEKGRIPSYSRKKEGDKLIISISVEFEAAVTCKKQPGTTCEAILTLDGKFEGNASGTNVSPVAKVGIGENCSGNCNGNRSTKNVKLTYSVEFDAGREPVYGKFVLTASVKCAKGNASAFWSMQLRVNDLGLDLFNSDYDDDGTPNHKDPNDFDKNTPKPPKK